MTTDFDLRRPRPRDALVDAQPLSSLQSLAAELGAVEIGHVTLLVDARPGWTVTYRLNIDGPQLAGWRQAAKDEDAPSGTDEFLWHRTICAGYATQISRHGDRLVDETGRPLTFFSEDFWRLLGVPAGAPSGATEAVKAFYANDYAIAAAADRVMADAGFGKAAVAEENPTKPR